MYACHMYFIINLLTYLLTINLNACFILSLFIEINILQGSVATATVVSRTLFTVGAAEVACEAAR